MQIAGTSLFVRIGIVIAGLLFFPVHAQRVAPEAPTGLALLESRGAVLGTTRFGSADLPPQGSAIRSRLEQAAEAGLGGFTLYLDWPALEPEPGAFSFDTVLAQLEALQGLGLQTFVNITVGDIGEYVLPAPFSDGDGGIAAGMSLDDPLLLQRFGALLDALVPELVTRGTFALAVGNEIDDRLEDSVDERAAYRSFLAAAKARVDALVPELPVGVTLTAAAHRNDTATRESLVQIADFVAINYAPIDPDFFVLPREMISADFRETLAAMPPGPVLIQELTCPNPVSLGASLAWQADCFDILLDEIARSPAVRFASVFSLEDFDGATCSAVQDILGAGLDDVPPDFLQRFLDYLCGLGVLAADGTPHPAWSVLLEFVQREPGEVRRALLRGTADY